MKPGLYQRPQKRHTAFRVSPLDITVWPGPVSFCGRADKTPHKYIQPEIEVSRA